MLDSITPYMLHEGGTAISSALHALGIIGVAELLDYQEGGRGDGMGGPAVIQEDNDASTTVAAGLDEEQGLPGAGYSSATGVGPLADAVRAQHDTLDVLINNAGILKTGDVETEAGRDIRFDVNTLAPYILTRRLLPIIHKDGRVVNLSSAAQAPVDPIAMSTFRPMTDMDAYAQSKLAITIWSAELARVLPDGPVFVAVNPGSLLASKMVKEGFGIDGNDLNIGADILIRASLSPEFAEATGRYFDNDSGAFAEPNQAAASLGHVTAVMDMIGKLTEPHITG